MDPLLNPYAPGAGAPPPELAGRDELLAKASIDLRRIAAGKFGRSMILTGLRGVGKTVLLNRMRQDAEASGIITVRFEIPEGRSLPSLLAPALKSGILKLNRGKAATDLVLRGLRALATFVKSMKLKYGDIEISLDMDAPSNFAISSNLDESLTQLFLAIGAAAKEKKTAIVLFVDELQVIDEQQLASLIMAIHVAAQDLLPITMIAAGLPQLPAKMGEAKTYAERLFEFVSIGPLDPKAAARALTVPAEKLGVHYAQESLAEILEKTQGYPYFIQEWGKHVWDIAINSPISKEIAEAATTYALADLDMSFFRVRYDQLTPMQKRYLRAMAELGAGPYASGKIANIYGKKVTALAPIRDQLINKGLIYSPAYGEIAFSAPLFDQFMKRMIKEL